MENSILFEQPANEIMRFCLRFEHLQQLVKHHQTGNDAWDSYHCVEAIVDLLGLLDRHDLRTKLSQELSRLLYNYKRLSKNPDIDSAKLEYVIRELDDLSTMIHQAKGKFADQLRENVFIQSIYRRMTQPAGFSQFQTPGLHLWMTLPEEKRARDIRGWLTQFDDIFAIINLMLRVTRDSSVPRRYTAESGFFQMALDPQMPCQLIRLRYATTCHAFPKISFGRHGVSIRFLQASMTEQAEQSPLNIPFELGVCCF